MADFNVPTYPDMFDQSQLANKYSPKSVSNGFPMYNYYGTPTDAMGNPIDSYKAPAIPVPAQTPGTTINSGPSSGAQFPVGSPLWQAQQRGAAPAEMQAMFGQMKPAYGNGVANPNYPQSLMAMMGGAGGSSAAGGGSGAASSIPSSGFEYLKALANPNKVVTPGITPPPRTNQPGSINLDALIANMKSAGMAPPQAQTGIVPGTGPSNGFLQTLAALRAGSPGAK